jgi:hypothetical protein
MDVNNRPAVADRQQQRAHTYIHKQSTVHTHTLTHAGLPLPTLLPHSGLFAETMMWWWFPVSCLLERLIAGHVVEWICAALKTRSQDLW